ncbi:hypothetical protein BZA70DRAFT_291071 [Myxozyma melibiosi]|uniref:Ribosome biogenesis protein ALB1 n=1 Tax=Myxozyma melibiosi TaxID=54550 RepID=A0ABR1F340_9ASCO
MPSKNSINKPKLAVKQSRKSMTGQKRATKRIAADNFKSRGIIKADSVMHSRALSRKQERKNKRNSRYMAQHGIVVEENGDVVMKIDEAKDIVGISRTQLKKEERQRLFSVDKVAGIEDVLIEMDIASSGAGTTLGGPPAAVVAAQAAAAAQ